MSRMVRIRIDDREVRMGLMRADKRIRNAIAQGGTQAIENTIKPDSQSIVPLDTGALMNSWYLKDKQTKNEYIWHMGYTEEYAVEQHENPDYKHAPGRQWQYLWVPMIRQFRRMLTMIAEKIKL